MTRTDWIVGMYRKARKHMANSENNIPHIARTVKPESRWSMLPWTFETVDCELRKSRVQKSSNMITDIVSFSRR